MAEFYRAAIGCTIFAAVSSRLIGVPASFAGGVSLGGFIVRSTILSEGSGFSLPRRSGSQLWWFGQMRATQPVDARYQLFLSVDVKVSCGFRYLKNHPFEAVETKPKPARTITVIRTPTANVIMLPPWS
jgi:hypothetical protein